MTDILALAKRIWGDNLGCNEVGNASVGMVEGYATIKLTPQMKAFAAALTKEKDEEIRILTANYIQLLNEIELRNKLS